MSSKTVKRPGTKRPTAKSASAQAASAKKAAGRAVAAAKPAGTPRKKSAQTQSPSHAQTHAPAEISHRIHALLHTMHQIERYEERLCSMQDAIRRSGKLSAPLLRDLRELVDELPSTEYRHDLDALRDAVG